MRTGRIIDSPIHALPCCQHIRKANRKTIRPTPPSRYSFPNPSPPLPKLIRQRKLIAQLRGTQILPYVLQPLLKRQQSIRNRLRVRHPHITPHAVRTRSEPSRLTQRASTNRRDL